MSLAQHNDLVALLILLPLALCLILLACKRTEHSLAQHYQRFRHVHRAGVLLLVAGVLVGITGIGIAAALLYSGGARFDPHRHQAPIIVAGGSTTQALPDLRGQVLHGENQGDTNACWAFGATNGLYSAEIARGMTPFTPSPWKTFWYGAGGADSTGTVEEAVAAINAQGVEPFADWPSMGPPDAHDAGVTVAYHGAHVRTIYYGAGYGVRATAAIDAELRAGHVVVILWDVHQGALVSGQPILHNTGGHVFYHFSLVDGEALLPDGSLGFTLANTWGPGWGSGGDALWSVAEVERDALAASVIEAGDPVRAWQPRPAATPTRSLPRPSPTATKTPTVRPRPTATPTSRPRPTASPAGTARYRVIHNTNLRAAPRTTAAIVRGVSVGAKATGSGWISTHWIGVRLGTASGYLWRAFTERTS